MKIPNSLKFAYDSNRQIYEDLSDYVEEILGSAAKKNKWHYEARVKELESFIQKVETGRIIKMQEGVKDLKSVEDIFACTIVVRNASEINSAKEIVSNFFDIKRCRPEYDNKTHKDSSSFVFDDKRLYVAIKKDPSLPSKIFSDIIFEVQIKTFLQHAWAIATHDMMYKAEGINWAEERIAYQVKAMLENAEISIQEVKNLSSNYIISKTNDKVNTISDIIKILNEFWPPESLPKNKKRLAETIYDFIIKIRVNVKYLRSCLKNEIHKQKGIPSNITPYSFFVQSILKDKKSEVQKMLRDMRNKKFIVVDSNAELPEWFSNEVNSVIIY